MSHFAIIGFGTSLDQNSNCGHVSSSSNQDYFEFYTSLVRLLSKEPDYSFVIRHKQQWNYADYLSPSNLVVFSSSFRNSSCLEKYQKY